ncbi:MAG: alpha-galactosidase, partial [Actinobacteria bacterium]|nr:alpha-galactosidase [Actinomycetota bacterium]
TGFDFDAKRLERFCAETAQVAGEVFLLDDGWFADAYPRNDDNAGLGDWEPNRAKLPDGLSGVGRDAAAAGVRFGIWVEPEMVNPESRLYHDHPDWVVAEVGRERRTERNQLQLDLCRPEVADHVVDVLDGVLEPDNGVSYVKWDANRMVTEPGSGALPADRQGNWPVDVVRATWAAMDRVVAAHPSTQLMLCASGGGRIDPGTLSRFHEVWLSDNTDPVDRVRMQWHAATFIPTEALAAHVTRWGDRPVAFACAVAMSARFGFDVNRDALSDEDWDVCRRASAQYRLIRPLVQHGNLIRLVSPEYGSSAALAFVDTDGLDAVVFAYRLPTRETDVEPMPDHITIPGLDATRTYVIESIELTGDPGPDATTATGETLRTNGLSWTTTEACTASMWRVTAS